MMTAVAKVIDISASELPRVAGRHAFQAPRYHIRRLAADTEAGWGGIPAVPVLTDLLGEEIPAREIRLRLAYDDAHLYLRACCAEPQLTWMPKVAPDSPDFWRQDHLEFRFLPDPAFPLEQVQFIFTPDGRFFDSPGLWRMPGAVETRGTITGDAWALDIRLKLDALHIPTEPGRMLHGIAAHVRWAEGWPDIAVISATQLGFPQAERFAEFIFDAGSCPVGLERLAFPERILARGDNPAEVVLMNTAAAAVSGRLLVTREPGPGDTGATRAYPLTLPPGETVLPLGLELARPRYTRYAFAFDMNGLASELGAVTLRAGVPAIAPDLKLQHPYLLFTEEKLREIERKLQNPAFRLLAAPLQLQEEDLQPADLPASGETPSLHFRTRKDFGGESFCKDICHAGPREEPTPYRRIWTLWPEEARAAARAVVDAVYMNDAQEALLTDALNALLARRDFHQEEYFRHSHFTPEVTALLARERAGLTDEETVRLNRLLIQQSYPLTVGATLNLRLADRIGRLLAKWVVSRDDRLAALANRYVEAADRILMPGRFTDLHEGGVSVMLALAYDTFHPLLTVEERAAWVRVLSRFLRLHLDTARLRHWNCTAIPNANAVCNGGGGLIALALLSEHPDAAESLYYARKFLWNFLDYTQGADGGNTEGAQYWQYGVDHFLRFAVGLENALGTDDGFLSHPSIRQAANMIRVYLCNDGSMSGVNDTVPVPVGGEIAYFVAGRFDDPLALWYGDHALRQYETFRLQQREAPYGHQTPFSLAYRPDVPEQTTQPPLPEVFLLPDIQYAMMRSGTNYDCALDAGLKGSRPPYTHHNQPDTGSFFIDVRGERLLIDPGYYKEEPTDHCLPLINGAGPVRPIDFTGKVIAAESYGDFRYLACDATRAYAGAAARCIRHLVMVGEEGLVLLDDIVAAALNGTVTAQYQAGGVTEDLDGGRAVLIHGRQARIRLDLLTRPALSLTLHPERSLHDTHWGYHFADCRLFPVTGVYTIDEQDPLITTFLDATGALPSGPSILRHENRLIVGMPSGRTVIFAYGNGRWNWEYGHQ